MRFEITFLRVRIRRLQEDHDAPPLAGGPAIGCWDLIGALTPSDAAAGTIAVAIGGQGERVETATLVIGSIGSWPIRLRKAEAILLEQGLTDAGIDAAAEAARADLGEVNNLFSPPGYKRRLMHKVIQPYFVSALFQ